MGSMLQRRPASVAGSNNPSAKSNHNLSRSSIVRCHLPAMKVGQHHVPLRQSAAITSRPDHTRTSRLLSSSNLHPDTPPLFPTSSQLDGDQLHDLPIPPLSHPQDHERASTSITHSHCLSAQTPFTTPNDRPLSAARNPVNKLLQTTVNSTATGTSNPPSNPTPTTSSPTANCTRRTATLSLAAAALATSATSSPFTTLAARAATAPYDGVGNNPGSSSSSSGISSSSSTPGSRFATQATSPAGQQQGLQEVAPEQPPQRPPQRLWVPVPQVALAPGLRVSKVIRGCWQLSGRHQGDPGTDRTSGGEAMADLATFHRAGITTVDTADNYGPSEALVGQYLRLNPDYAARTTVLTKLSYVTEEDMAGVSRTLVQYAVRGCLARQGRSHLDLVQLQWAEPGRHRRWLDVLKWLADLREQGLIRHIGVSNFSVPLLAKAVDAGVGLVSNQVAFSLIDRRPQLYMQQAAEAYGIKLLAYGTLAGGLLADKYYEVPAGRVRLDTASKQKYGLLLNQAGSGGSSAATIGGGTSGGGGGWGWMQEVLAATRSVALRHGVPSSVVALAWVLQQPQVAAAVVGARNARHIRNLQAACALTLDDTDMLDLDAVWEGVPNPPSSDVYIWERGGPW